ncbi:MAG: hypothetical protein Q4D41_07930 [Prevotellaceae bacterium]|nr:hypothetical protein [Prevotellaceae bacterium]
MKHLTMMRKPIFSLVVCLMALYGLPINAQEDKYKDYNEVYRDTVDYVAPTQTTLQNDTIFDPLRVVTNKFGKNWFVFATAGVHSFRGDYSSDGTFNGTLSPEWGVGIGKWFTPGVGLKVEFIRSNSRGYTEYLTGHYGYGETMLKDDNTPYRRMKTSWWDISASAILNLTRLFYGYEGYNSPKRMNQFMLNLGIGGVHHLGYGHSHGSDNEWSGHAELQYSRFFNRKKRFSLDFKLRGIFYQTNFDLEYGQADHAAYKWDCNLGVALGFTFYLDRQRSNGWRHGTQTVYQRDYRERKILVVKEKDKTVAYNTLTFYVFYPNNYSGRNDAPNVQDAVVNTLDYLAGGIFTQKKYANNGDVANRMARGVSLNGLATADIPTETADRDFEIDYVPRGYEMTTSAPLSLSLKSSDMTAFREKAGFYYAPIYDGQHVWQYRIDNETMGQSLLTDDNYTETDSYGLNAHSGLGTVRQNMDVDNGDELVSFADVYAAMNSNNGYISQFADAKTVEHIRQILEQGSITMIQTEGLATSQDNFTGADAERVGKDRNTALSQNRANSVISWLKSKPRLNDVSSQIFMVSSLSGPIRTVTDTSTRGLSAKLNRCVKVRILYMLK